MPLKVSARQRYETLAKGREPALRMARQCAKYTLPYLQPPEGYKAGMFLPSPRVSVAAQGVNQLASKMLLMMLPPSGGGGFKLDGFPNPESDHSPESHSRAQARLLKIERLMQRHLASGSLRRSLDEALKLLLVTGNVCLVFDEHWGARVYRLDQMVCRRDPSTGLPLEVITLEETDIALLPDDVWQASFGSKGSQASRAAFDGPDGGDDDKTAKILTHWIRDQTHWYCHQEINDVLVRGSEGQWPVKHAPLVVPTTNCPDGEHYGHSHTETILEFLIKLYKFETLLYEAASAEARVLILRNPNGLTSARDLERDNLSIINGVPGDVSALRMNKGSELAGAAAQHQYYTQKIQQAFLQAAGMHRDGERVTAEEVRRINAESEFALGGIYISCSEQLLRPLLEHTLWLLQEQGYIPRLDPDEIEVRIIAGSHAISREHQLGQLRGFLQDMQVNNPEQMQRAGINSRDLVYRLAVCWGIDPTGLVMTPEQQQQESQQAQLQQLLQSAGPDVIQQYTRGAFPQLMGQ